MIKQSISCIMASMGAYTFLAMQSCFMEDILKEGLSFQLIEHYFNFYLCLEGWWFCQLYQVWNFLVINFIIFTCQQMIDDINYIYIIH